MSHSTQSYRLFTLLKSATTVSKEVIAKDLGVAVNSVPVYVHELKKQFKAEIVSVRNGRKVTGYQLIDKDVAVPQFRKNRVEKKISKKAAKKLEVAALVDDGSVSTIDPDADITKVSEGEFNDIRRSLGVETSFRSMAAVAVSAAAQNATAQNKIPRAADGHPDLTGIWTNASITPFERPSDLAGKEFFTVQEAVAYERSHQRNLDQRDDIKGTNADVTLAYNDAWWDRGTRLFESRRTSVVIDPPDGRIPPLTAERKRQLAAIAEARRKRCEQPGCGLENNGQLGPADGPEDRPVMERCLSFGNVAPMVSTAYNNDYEIVQTADFIGIDVEMVHQLRRIPLDGSPHIAGTARFWAGDSRGRWEGDTLIIDTTNFRPETAFRGADENLHLIERLTRLAGDSMRYQFTVDDPTAFTKLWTGELIFTKSKGLLYEYACHEGNEGMSGILSGARADERKAAASSAKSAAR